MVYIPRRLGGLVDAIMEIELDEPVRFTVMPNGKIELLFMLEGSEVDEFFMSGDEPGNRVSPLHEFSLFFGASTGPQFLSARRLRGVVIIMSTLAAKAFFGIPASELWNRTIVPTMLDPRISEIQDKLNTLGSFRERAQFLEKVLWERIEGSPELPVFLSLSQGMENYFSSENDLVPSAQVVLDHVGYSRSQLHRLSKEWLGGTIDQGARLHQFRRALHLLHRTGDPVAEVAAGNGYFDQAHFAHRFSQHAGMTPSQYRRATKDVSFDTVVWEKSTESA